MTAAGPRGDAPQGGGPLGDVLARALAEIDFSGVLLAVGPDGILAEVAQGIADRATGRPIAMSCRFGIASVSKLFTAITLARLFERGAVGPDARLVDVLPADARPRDLDPAVTLEHLLTHTSGIADYADEYGDESYDEIWTRANPTIVRAPRDLLPLMVDLPARARPGTEVRYNNGAFVFAGLAIEAITGRSFYDEVADAVLIPAGMSATGYPAFDEVIPDIAIGYLPPPDGEPSGAWRSNIFMLPARGQPDGGAFGTAADLVRFLDAFREGRLVGAAWRDEMVRPRVHDGAEDVEYGLAWQHRGDGVRRSVGHTGGDPGYVAIARSYPASGIRLVVLANRPGRAWPAAAIAETELIGEQDPAGGTDGA